jgi:HlyD family secretion protein
MSLTEITPHSRPVVPRPEFQDEPSREIWIGGAIAVLFFVIGLGWAAFAPLAAGAVAHGTVAVAGNRQAVQHRDGGIVSALHVKEGDFVQRGQVLLEIAAGELRASERALASQVLRLEASRVRLQAERDGLATVPPPPEFAGLTGEDKVIADDALRLEQLQLNARRAALSTQQGVLTQRVGQLSQQIQGYNRQLAANDEQQRLSGEELEGYKSLAAKGYAPQTKVRALESQIAALKGNSGSYEAEVARTRDAIGEAKLQMTANQKQHMEEVVDQLRQTELQLSEAQPKWLAARDQLARAQVRSPATGRVVGLSVFTVGGVVAPGQKLMEIVPQNAGLIVDAMVSPNDADDLRVGQQTEVRFPSFHERRLPVLHGVITELSADAFTDEKTGARYFKAQVTVPPKELATITQVRGPDAGLKPGLPVEVVVPLRKRTALQYFLEPLQQTVWKSFREH